MIILLIVLDISLIILGAVTVTLFTDDSDDIWSI